MSLWVRPLSGANPRIYFHSPWPPGTLEPGACPVRGKHGHLYLDAGPRVYASLQDVTVEQKPCPCGKKIGGEA